MGVSVLYFRRNYACKYDIFWKFRGIRILTKRSTTLITFSNYVIIKDRLIKFILFIRVILPDPIYNFNLIFI